MPERRRILIPRAPGNDALALALRADPNVRVIRRAVKPGADYAELDAVLWKATPDASFQAIRGAELHDLNRKLPEQAYEIILEYRCRTAGQENSVVQQIKAPVYFNPDDSVSYSELTLPTPEQAASILERDALTAGDAANSTAAVKRRNRVREQLGKAHPEKALAEAALELLATNPLPQVPLTRAITLPAPGGKYAVTITPLEQA